MRQIEPTLNKKEFLLSLCNDYKLPVSPSDNIEILENHLKAVTDEAVTYPEATDDFLENEPVYIGKYESAIFAYFKRLIWRKPVN